MKLERLETITKEDINTYYRLSRDAKVRRYCILAYANNPEKANQKLQKFLSDSSITFYKIMLDNVFVGYFILINKWSITQIIVVIGEEYRNKGYATEAIKKLKDILTPKSNELQRFIIDTDNTASLALALKANLKKAGTYVSANYDTMTIWDL